MWITNSILKNKRHLDRCVHLLVVLGLGFLFSCVASSCLYLALVHALVVDRSCTAWTKYKTPPKTEQSDLLICMPKPVVYLCHIVGGHNVHCRGVALGLVRHAGGRSSKYMVPRPGSGRDSFGDPASTAHTCTSSRESYVLLARLKRGELRFTQTHSKNQVLQIRKRV